jgi:3-hydroxyacyl-CoA dehydrogenase/enoyl-CoA hydratase/3-hydroxybutyryl-CoA epimerase
MKLFQTTNLRLESLNSGTAILWLDVANRPVNVFNPQVMDDLDAALNHVAIDADCKVLILRSAKSSGFIAGADLHEFAGIESTAEATALSERGQRLFDKLAEIPHVTIAVISGPCLGGGLECALACDYRLSVDHPKTQIGLPEIELGLLPGWGGTQRLPRVIGLEPALRMILGRQRLNGREALKWGLADALVTGDADLPAKIDELVERAQREGKRPKRGLPLRNWRQKLVESNPLGRLVLFRGTERMLRQRVPDDMPAPWEALKAIKAGLSRGMTHGLELERQAVGKLAMTPACRNLVTLFFLHERARKIPAEAKSQVRPIRKIGMVGAGTMGAGIAQLAAIKGYELVVQEVNDGALAAGVRKIEDLFRKAAERRVLSPEEANAKVAAIGKTTTWQGFGDVDLVVEAAIEDLDAKRGIFRELEKQTRPDTILATNTSSLVVERLLDGLQHPERVGGLHFFNPVHKMPLVEVVRTPQTDAATWATLMQFAIDLGKEKTPVVVKDSPGFVVNRILMPYVNEAVLLLQEGAFVEKIDRIMRRFGMPMGPLELLDQVGLDIAAHIEKSMRPFVEQRFQPNVLFAQMCERGWLGAKNNSGFYLYPGKNKKKIANPGLENNPPEALKRANPEARREPSAEESRERMVLLMVNEAAACFENGLADDAETIDLAMVFGTGWAPHRGGPLRYADQRGASDIVRVLKELAKAHGPRFEPCALLRRHAEAGEPFCKLTRSALGEPDPAQAPLV